MTPPAEDEQNRFRGDPKGDPLNVVLYRLSQIERRMDRLLSAELYKARHEAIQARVEQLEREQDESNRSIRQIAVGLIVAVGTAIVTAAFTIF